LITEGDAREQLVDAIYREMEGVERGPDTRARQLFSALPILDFGL
jgi:hypothetical protein